MNMILDQVKLSLLLFARPKDSPAHSLITSIPPQRSARSTSKVGHNEQASCVTLTLLKSGLSEIIFVVFCKRILSEIVVTTSSIYHLKQVSSDFEMY